MMHSLPTTSAKKQRDRRIIAMVMAIMLHILIAGIVYFTVFDKNPSATLAPISVDDKHSILTTTQIQQQTSLALAENTDIAAKPGQPFAPKSNNNVTNSHKAATTRTPNQSQKSAVNSTGGAYAVSIPDQKNHRAEYTLNQTKEYEALDADIEKDSEQLSKLITEVKKRNQRQIQQHQLPNNNIDNQPSVEYDYPITPITPLSTENKNSAVE